MLFWELTPPPGVTLDKTFCVPVFLAKKKSEFFFGKKKESLIFGSCKSLSHRWLLCPLVILAFCCLTKLLWLTCLLLTPFLFFSGQLHWILCLRSWEASGKTGQLWWEAYREKGGAGVARWERERTKQGRVLAMTKSGCFCCDITFNVQNLTLTISDELCGPCKLLTEHSLKS